MCHFASLLFENDSLDVPNCKSKTKIWHPTLCSLERKRKFLNHIVFFNQPVFSSIAVGDSTSSSSCVDAMHCHETAVDGSGNTDYSTSPYCFATTGKWDVQCNII